LAIGTELQGIDQAPGYQLKRSQKPNKKLAIKFCFKIKRKAK